MEQPIEIVFFSVRELSGATIAVGALEATVLFLMLTFLLGKQCNGIVLSDFFFDA